MYAGQVSLPLLNFGRSVVPHLTASERKQLDHSGTDEQIFCALTHCGETAAEQTTFHCMHMSGWRHDPGKEAGAADGGRG